MKILFILALFLILLLFVYGCATAPEPKASVCLLPPGASLIADEDVAKANAEYARVVRELRSCKKGWL